MARENTTPAALYEELFGTPQQGNYVYPHCSTWFWLFEAALATLAGVMRLGLFSLLEERYLGLGVGRLASKGWLTR